MKPIKRQSGTLGNAKFTVKKKREEETDVEEELEDLSMWRSVTRGATYFSSPPPLLFSPTRRSQSPEVCIEETQQNPVKTR